MFSLRVWIGTACLAILSTIANAENLKAETAPKYLGPADVVVSRDGGMLYVAERGANRIAFVDISQRSVVRTVKTFGEPAGLALSPDGAELYVTCASERGGVVVMDPASGRQKAKIRAGNAPCGPAVSPDGKLLYVCNRFHHSVSVIDTELRKEVATIPATRQPAEAAVTPDGECVVVINHLPAGRADRRNVASVATIIDTQSHEPSTVRLTAGSGGLRDVCISPDGKYAYITHILARYELPTIQIEYGWINANALSIVSVSERKLLGTVLLDDKDRGASNPWGVDFSSGGKWICVAHAGTGELSVIDAPRLLEKLSALPVTADPEEVEEVLYDDRNELLDYFRRLRAVSKGEPVESGELYTLGTRSGVSNDLEFLSGLRRRVKLKGKGPRSLAVAGSKAYVAEYFTDTVAVLDLETADENRVQEIALGPKPQPGSKRRGEMLFNSGRLCFQNWQSCASCHPGGRSDGLNWDLLNDGVGHLKNTKSLLFSHKTPPVMSSGVRPAAESAVRAGIKHILFTKPAEKDAEAIDAYLKSLKPAASPHLVNGRLSRAARRGKKLFFRKEVGCFSCHPPPLYTDMKKHDVDSKGPCDYRRKFDTPTLIEVWRTSPYLHDGRYSTIKELFTKGKHCLKKSELKLTERQINDLTEFVLSL